MGLLCNRIEVQQGEILEHARGNGVARVVFWLLITIADHAFRCLANDR